MFLPPTSAFGAGLYSVAVYGGLVLFGMFLLYDTQLVVKRAETLPVYGVVKYDPINAWVFSASTAVSLAGCSHFLTERFSSLPKNQALLNHSTG